MFYRCFTAYIVRCLKRIYKNYEFCAEYWNSPRLRAVSYDYYTSNGQNCKNQQKLHSRLHVWNNWGIVFKEHSRSGMREKGHHIGDSQTGPRSYGQCHRTVSFTQHIQSAQICNYKLTTLIWPKVQVNVLKYFRNIYLVLLISEKYLISTVLLFTKTICRLINTHISTHHLSAGEFKRVLSVGRFGHRLYNASSVISFL